MRNALVHPFFSPLSLNLLKILFWDTIKKKNKRSVNSRDYNPLIMSLVSISDITEALHVHASGYIQLPLENAVEGTTHPSNP